MTEFLHNNLANIIISAILIAAVIFAIIKIIAASQFETAQTYLYKNRNTDIQAFSAGIVILLVLTMVINLIVHKNAAKDSKRRKEENV